MRRGRRGRGTLGHPIGFGFERVILTTATPEPNGLRTRPDRCLHDVRQFVAEQVLPLPAVRVVLAAREIDVGPVGEGERVDGRRFVPDVDAHVGEIGAHRVFHPLANGGRQRLTRAAPEHEAVRHLKRLAAAAALNRVGGGDGARGRGSGGATCGRDGVTPRGKLAWITPPGIVRRDYPGVRVVIQVEAARSRAASTRQRDGGRPARRFTHVEPCRSSRGPRRRRCCRRAGKSAKTGARQRDRAVGERVSVIRIMRHVNRRQLQLTLQRRHLSAQVQPQVDVEVGKWLVQQQHVREPTSSARERHALLLSARQLVRVAIQPAHTSSLHRRRTSSTAALRRDFSMRAEPATNSRFPRTVRM